MGIPSHPILAYYAKIEGCEQDGYNRKSPDCLTLKSIFERRLSSVKEIMKFSMDDINTFEGT